MRTLLRGLVGEKSGMDAHGGDLRTMLVVETDGLRYHRTAAQQARDRIRDQAHATAGLTTLRFTYHQVARCPDQVERTLRRVADRLLLI